MCRHYAWASASASPKLLRMQLGQIGIWHSRSKGDPGVIAPEIERLGYGALWLGGSPSVEQARAYVEATTTLPVITGILNVWQHDPADVARDHHQLDHASIRTASCSASGSATRRRRATTRAR